MEVAIIITLCSLLLLAYLFDFTSGKTKIPSVILLLGLGWVVRQITVLSGIQLPGFLTVLPILGTVGLILIVLEGALELELNKSKFPLIRKSFVAALLPLIASAFLLSLLFRNAGHFTWQQSLINAIPFCVISSAIAIPSVRNLTSSMKEFVIYESSLSDILGVLFFNFVALNDQITPSSFGGFGLQLLLITTVSFVATMALSFLLSKIDHHVKFVPIILLVILIYAVSKVYHLPGLIFILLFGLFIGNLDELKHWKWIEKLRPVEFNKEVYKFKELTSEATFLVRALFFLLFGYLLETSEVLNTATLLWSISIVGIIFTIRMLQFKLLRMPLKPLVFVAPRGLITVLLFLSITPHQSIAFVSRSLVIQVVIMTALVMMVGLMLTKTKATDGNGATDTVH